MSKPSGQGVKGCSLQSLLKSEEGSDPTKEEAMSGTVVGCCHGVVCCYDYKDERFWLWNPAIRVRIELPDNRGLDLEKFGFGWDESSCAYKVFAVLFDRKHNERRGRVYSYNSKSWRTIPSGSLCLLSVHGVFLRGNLHWFDMSHYQIECFDLEREEFGRIELPSIAPKDGFYYRWSCLGEIGGCLGMLYNTNKQRLDVWVMKEYGVKDSWFKLFSFNPTAVSVDSVPRSFAYVPFFGEGPNGEVFAVYGRNLMVPKTMLSQKPPIMSASSQLISTLKV